uniref:Rd1NTF2_05_I64F_A80G_T94P_D101K_L106W n=1 Tax=synthetic construct TaxID=32630 RepID=UPI00143F05B7|nr:Chain A, Rd1NTF2_05_I64F_A80G_T94P_D101K_L106W [synthetic construct]6W3F_B Chain B, Rd1NTF2_05_I64F_A80G_T94P_D101K_L106W [synthetic construct]
SDENDTARKIIKTLLDIMREGDEDKLRDQMDPNVRADVGDKTVHGREHAAKFLAHIVKRADHISFTLKSLHNHNGRLRMQGEVRIVHNGRTERVPLEMVFRKHNGKWLIERMKYG